MTTDDREVLEFVRSGRVAAPPALAERLRRARQVPAAPPAEPRRRLGAALLVAAGVVVAFAVALLQRQVLAPQPADATIQDPQEPAPGGGSIDGAAALLQRAPLVLVCDVHFPSGVRATDGLFATVQRVVVGPPVLAGKEVWLHWNGKDAVGGRSCLDQQDLRQVPFACRTWLLALRPMTPAEAEAAGPTQTKVWAERAAKLSWLCSTAGAGLWGTPAAEQAPAAAASTDLLRLQGELVAAARQRLQQREPGRAQALAALRQYDGGGAWAADSPWRDPALAEAFAGNAADPDPEVRRELAAALPQGRGGSNAERALRRLLVDPVAAVRCEVHARAAGQSFCPRPPTDGLWTGATRPWWLARYIGTVSRKVESDGVGDLTSALLDKLADRDANQRLLGALALGIHAGPGTLARLQALADTDTRVVAAAAGSRLELGDHGGYAVLRGLLTHERPFAAICALDMLRRHRSAESLDIVCTAATHGDPWVRALVAGALADMHDLAPDTVDAALARLARDPHALVRVVAGDEPFTLAQPVGGEAARQPR